MARRIFLAAFVVVPLAAFGLAGAAYASMAPRPVLAAPRSKASSASTTTPSGARARSGAASGKAARKNPVVEMVHVNRHETMQLRLRDTNGKPVRGQQKRFDRFLRCHYTNVQHSMNPRLIAVIYRTGRHWPGHRIEVVSGYRHPKVAKNPRSPHMKGLACDFRVAGVTNQELRDYLRHNFEKVGVGYYPNSSFVHLDVRKDHSAFWIDYSGPGERALYSAAPGDDLKSGRADRFHPSKIDRSWAESAGQVDQPNEEDTAPPAAAAEPAGPADSVVAAPSTPPGTAP